MSNVLSPAAVTPDVPAPSHDSVRMSPVRVLTGAFLAMALAGVMAERQSAPSGTLSLPASPAPVYAGLILMEWGLAYYVWKVGLRRSAASLRMLIGGGWRSTRAVAVDVGLGLATWAAWSAVSLAWQAWWGSDPAASLQSIMPQTPLEVALWILLSVSAGFSEELVFRGYLQERFQALTGNAAVAVLLQAALFGVSHGYQGGRRCLRITVYALVFGALTRWRRSLRPGMVAHAWTDLAAGLLRI